MFRNMIKGLDFTFSKKIVLNFQRQAADAASRSFSGGWLRWTIAGTRRIMLSLRWLMLSLRWVMLSTRWWCYQWDGDLLSNGRWGDGLQNFVVKFHFLFSFAWREISIILSKGEISIKFGGEISVMILSACLNIYLNSFCETKGIFVITLKGCLKCPIYLQF